MHSVAPDYLLRTLPALRLCIGSLDAQEGRLAVGEARSTSGFEVKNV